MHHPASLGPSPNLSILCILTFFLHFLQLTSASPSAVWPFWQGSRTNMLFSKGPLPETKYLYFKWLGNSVTGLNIKLLQRGLLSIWIGLVPNWGKYRKAAAKYDKFGKAPWSGQGGRTTRIGTEGSKAPKNRQTQTSTEISSQKDKTPKGWANISCGALDVSKYQVLVQCTSGYQAIFYPHL